MLKIARKELHDAKSETWKSASGIASLNTRIATAQSNLDLVVLAARLVARHFERIVQLCPHEVMHTLPSSDHASVIRSVAGCSNQDIHIDAMENGWSFLTALERDQEVLILWNGYTCLCIMEPLIKDRKAACAMVRDTVMDGAH